MTQTTGSTVPIHPRGVFVWHSGQLSAMSENRRLHWEQRMTFCRRNMALFVAPDAAVVTRAAVSFRMHRDEQGGRHAV